MPPQNCPCPDGGAHGGGLPDPSPRVREGDAGTLGEVGIDDGSAAHPGLSAATRMTPATNIEVFRPIVLSRRLACAQRICRTRETVAALYSVYRRARSARPIVSHGSWFIAHTRANAASKIAKPIA